MKFNYLPLPWYADGVEPPETLKTEGWLVGHKPPAAYFNHKFRTDFLTMTELQQKLSNLSDTHEIDVSTLQTAIVQKSPIESPNFTGVPKAPTPDSASNSDDIATTAFVKTVVGMIDLSSFGSKTVYIANANLNSLVEDKSYICAGTLSNTPIPTTYCAVRCWDTPNTDRIIQLCFVPDLSTNVVRTFTRAVNAGVSFGAWREFATTADVTKELDIIKMLLEEDKFRNKATLQAMNKAIFTLFIETFETLDDVNLSAGSGEIAILSAYSSDKHIFLQETADGQLILQSQAKIITGGNNNAWCFVDYIASDEGASVTIEISRDAGTTWTTLNHNETTSIASQPSGVQIICRVTLSGKVTFKNIAWGVK